MKERLRQFMSGRYGNDDLNRFMSIAALVLLVISMLTKWTIFNSLAMAVLILSIFRTFSKNTAKRGQENYAYLRLRGKVTGWFTSKKKRFAQRKTHRFYKCPKCRTQLRVPKGVGNINITCPKCKTSFKKKA